MTANYNTELNGIELSFESKPSEIILNLLRETGYRWHNVKKIWYAKQNEKTIKAAQQIAKNENKTIPEVKTISKSNIKKSLFERLQFTEGTATNNKINCKFVGSNYTGLTVKETAVEIRKVLKDILPEVKFSITSDYNSIDITIKSSPYEYKHLEYISSRDPAEYRAFERENNKEIEAIQEYCKRLLNSYNYDDSDSQTDYFDVHFYKNISMYRDYEQTEQTETIKKDIENFRQSLINEQREKEAEAERQYQKRLAEIEIQKEENKKIEKIAAEHKEYIINNIFYTDLSTDKQYMIFNSQFAKLNKNQRLSDYIEEVQSGEYNTEDVKIEREVHFNTLKALNYFNDMFLTDFDFISGTGGSYTDDPRVNSMIDYSHMTKEERSTVKFYLKGIAVFYNNELQYVINSEGYDYARYVGLIDESYKGIIPQPETATEEIEYNSKIANVIENISTEIIYKNDILNNWQGNKSYYKMMIEALKPNKIKLSKDIIQQIKDETLKQELYTLMNWSDELPQQFEEANIKQGEKLTLYYFSGMGWVSESHITFDNYIPCQYAQYENSIKLTFGQENKKGLFYNHFHRGQNLAIFKGWHKIPEFVLWDIKQNNGTITRMSKYSSCDKQQLNEIINYYDSQELEPIILDKSTY